ncbi:MAG: hypothetical protein IPM92_06965 [Saprospiraceae bacterium]|nr:hypothetical protein [Saprospiraceae bacterium]
MRFLYELKQHITEVFVTFKVEFMRSYLFLIVVILLNACSKPEENYIKIPSEFYAIIQEEVLPGGTRQLFLELSSITSQYCQSDSLVYHSTVNANEIQIEVLDSYKANDCFQKQFPLKSRIALPTFTDTLNILIELGNASLIKAQIYSAPKEYLMTISEGQGLQLKYPQTYKIPNNLVWGFVYPIGSDPTNEIMLQNFIKDLEFDCYTNWLPKGYYSYFDIKDNNTVVLTYNPGFVGSYRNFYYTHKWSDLEMQNFFQNLSTKYSNLIGYNVISGNGFHFSSH